MKDLPERDELIEMWAGHLNDLAGFVVAFMLIPFGGYMILLMIAGAGQ